MVAVMAVVTVAVMAAVTVAVMAEAMVVRNKYAPSLNRVG